MNDRPAPTLLSLGVFTGVPQHENFCRLKDLLPSRRMAAATTPRPFAAGEPITLPPSYTFDGTARPTADFLAATDTAALLVLKDGQIRLEQYALTGGPDVPWMSWSVSKSFVSALVGIAIDEGLIGGIDQPLSDYVPVKPGSAYDGVRIKDVLQMSSGGRWSEVYSDPNSDIFRLGAAMAGAITLDEFVATTVPESPPGTVCRYSSADTQALGTLLVKATGRSLTDYMREKICDPLGFESDSYWLIDPSGREMAFAGLNLTARDAAKLGELYRNHGRSHGRQIVPEAWARASVRADAPHLQPGRTMIGTQATSVGYGYQWWLLDGDRSEFAGMGVYNQLIYVDPSRGVVIVKLSANRSYGTSTEESANRNAENFTLLRAISASLGD